MPIKEDFKTSVPKDPGNADGSFKIAVPNKSKYK